jgi:polyisoprenyl-teichoic acid--peptidoglycan teichoic acid transferase
VAKDSRLLRIYYPRLGVPHSSFSVSSPRAYRICGPHGHCWASYRMTIARNPLLGEYYGLQGTRWKDPPIIKSPTEVIEYHGRRMMVFKDGARVRLVAWQTKDATYWISNTLLQTISKDDMLAIARAAKPLS